MSEDVEGADKFMELLGAFGSNADVQERKRSERKAAMKSTDGRRRKGPGRDLQFNVRVTQRTRTLIDRLIEREDCSQATLAERMVEAYARWKAVDA